MKPKPGITLTAPRGEEWIEYSALNFLGNTAAVIREGDLDLVHAEATAP